MDGEALDFTLQPPNEYNCPVPSNMAKSVKHIYLLKIAKGHYWYDYQGALSDAASS